MKHLHGRVFVVAVIAGLMVGCTRPSAPNNTVPVSGTVTLDGKPMADGEIYFKTDATGELEILEIKQGAFHGQVAKGNRRVEIFAYHETQVVPMPGMKPQASRENYIPAQYNHASTLRAEIKPEGTSRLSFAVTSR